MMNHELPPRLNNDAERLVPETEIHAPMSSRPIEDAHTTFIYGETPLPEAETNLHEAAPIDHEALNRMRAEAKAYTDGLWAPQKYSFVNGVKEYNEDLIAHFRSNRSIAHIDNEYVQTFIGIYDRHLDELEKKSPETYQLGVQRIIDVITIMDQIGYTSIKDAIARYNDGEPLEKVLNGK